MRHRAGECIRRITPAVAVCAIVMVVASPWLGASRRGQLPVELKGKTPPDKTAVVKGSARPLAEVGDATHPNKDPQLSVAKVTSRPWLF